MKKVSKKVVALMVLTLVLLAGCGEKKDTHQTPEIPEGFVFNTGTDEQWGDEAEFFRMADFSRGVVRVSEFAIGKAEVEAGMFKAMAVYCHNTSDQDQKTVVQLSYPETVAAGKSEEAHVSIICDAGAINSSMTFNSEADLALGVAKDAISIQNQSNPSESVSFTPTGISMEGIVTILVEVEIPAGSTYVIFYGLQAAPNEAI